MNIGIYIYNLAEVLDFSGPFEVFSTASRICENDDPFSTFLIGETGQVVNARGGFNVIPHFGFANHPPIDVLIVAGGRHIDEMDKSQVIKWISQQAQKAKQTASVCTGAFLLAQAKVLRVHKVTTHWQDCADLNRRFPKLEVVEGVRWVDQGDILTSAGISAGIDMSLYLVGKLYNTELAERTAKQMDFSWTQNP